MKVSFEDICKIWTFPLELNNDDDNLYSQKNQFGNRVKTFESYESFKKLSHDMKAKLVEKINGKTNTKKNNNPQYTCDFEKIYYKGESFLKIRGWTVLVANKIPTELALEYEQSLLDYVTNQLNG